MNNKDTSFECDTESDTCSSHALFFY